MYPPTGAIADSFRLAVLNPGGRDPEQNYPMLAGSPEDSVAHPPVNFHAYAACTGGIFYQDPSRISEPCILMVVRRDLKHCLKVLKDLKEAGRCVAVTLKESGLHQVGQLLADASNMERFREICRLANGCIASTQELTGLYASAGAKHVRFIPTPYPVGERSWNFSIPPEMRAGIFIGTREWDTPTRNHAAALLLAARIGGPVTVINEDGRSGRKRIEATGLTQPQIIDGRLPYTEYLRLVARHRIVLQLDRSSVPGQVAGDALLCGIPCVGGDGAIERVAFPDTCGYGRRISELGSIAGDLLAVEVAYSTVIARSKEIAKERLSFATIAGELETFFAEL